MHVFLRSMPALVAGLLVSSSAFAAAPTGLTDPPGNVTGSSATLRGVVDAGGEPTTAWFRYSATHPGTCDDGFGARVPTAGISVGVATGAQPVQFTVAGLSPGATYHYCVLASNASGLAASAVQSFTALAVPDAATLPATNITSGTARLHGTGLPRGLSATGSFRLGTTSITTCTSTYGSRVPSSGGVSLGDGQDTVPFSESVTGLTPATRYYYCAVVENAAGLALGTVQTFFVPALPLVNTTTPQSPGATTHLRAVVDPRGSPTYGWFRWATVHPGTCNDAFGTRAPAAGADFIGEAAFGTILFTHPVSGLLPSTTYYTCAIVENEVGMALGDVETFTTPPLPQASTLPATLGTSTVTLAGTVDPAGVAGQGWFRYAPQDPGGCDDSFGARAPATGHLNVSAFGGASGIQQQVSGLAPGVTYYYCAIGANPSGLAFGQLQTFTLSGPPAVSTGGASQVAARHATLEGTAVAHGSPTTAWFRYSTTDPGACNDTFGTRTPANGGTSVGNGYLQQVAFSQTIQTSVFGGTYFFCAIAENSLGKSFGPVQSFQAASAPQVTTQPATNAGPLTTTLNGTANPRGEATEGWFRYSLVNPGSCNDFFGTRFPATGGRAVGDGTQPVPFGEVPPGLASGNTWYFCALAGNATGVSYGTVQSISIPDAPVVTTQSAVNVLSTSADLRGQGIPLWAPSEAWFRYSTNDPGSCNDTFGIRMPATGGFSLGAGGTATQLTQPLTGLTPHTWHYFCVIGENVHGKGYGARLAFKTGGPPTVATLPAQSVTTTAASLRGSVDGHGRGATAWFRHGPGVWATCSDSVGSRAPATGGHAISVSSVGAVPVSETITGLQPNTTYSYCTIAQGQSVALGNVGTFTTPPMPPVVTTMGIGPFGNGSVTLRGSANPNGVPATGFFRVGTTHPGTCSASHGFAVPAPAGIALSAGNSPVPFETSSAGLMAGGTYYFCAVATNSAGTVFGPVQSFTMPNAPLVTGLDPTNLGGSTATFHGTATPNGSATVGFFLYGPTPPPAGGCQSGWGWRAPISGGTALGAGTTAVAFSRSLGGLSPGTTYYVCAAAENAVGTRYGGVQTFVTLGAPSIASASASNVTSSAAVLSATASTGGARTHGFFRFSAGEITQCSDSFGTRVPASGGEDLGDGEAPVSWALSAEGLVQGVTYYYCALARNEVGLATGEVQAFTAAIDPPVVTTAEATGISSRDAILNGQMPLNAQPARGWFRIASTKPPACDDTFGQRVPLSGEAVPLVENGQEHFALTASGLRPNSTYHWCAMASNAGGASFGEVKSFTTLREKPKVLTAEPTRDDEGRPVLRGQVQPNGAAGVAWFQVSDAYISSCDRSTGRAVPGTNLHVAGTMEALDIEHVFTEATPGTWYFCAAAETAGGEAFGSVFTVEIARTPEVGTAGGCGVAPNGAWASAGAWLLLGVLGLRRRRQSRS